MEVSSTKKNKKAKRSQELFLALKKQIESMELVPGDRLPSEGDIAERYGVSRITVRAALQKLEALDLVETRTGGGTYVKKFSFSDILESISPLLVRNVSVDDLTSFRRAIEPASIEALRGKLFTTKDIKALEQIYAKMEEAARQMNAMQFAAADFEFHMELCRIGGNRMIIYSYELARYVMIDYFQRSYSPQLAPAGQLSTEEYYANALQYHADIIAACRENDIDRCLAIEHSLVSGRDC